MIRNFFLAPLLVFSLTYAAWQEKPAPQPQQPPALTEVQKLQIQNLTQRLEIAQLRMQAAQADFDKAREEIGVLVKSLHVAGWDLNLQTMTYQKKAEEKK